VNSRNASILVNQELEILYYSHGFISKGISYTVASLCVVSVFDSW